MHGRVPATAHLVPIIARHLQFGGDRHFHLGHGEKIVEPGFACNFLRQEPEHVLAGRGFGEPREEWIALPGTGVPEFLEPLDEPVDVVRDVRHERAYRLAHCLDIFSFGTRDAGVIVDLLAPGFVWKARLELSTVIFAEFGLKANERGARSFCGTDGP